jgi:hypothetical protein
MRQEPDGLGMRRDIDQRSVEVEEQGRAPQIGNRQHRAINAAAAEMFPPDGAARQPVAAPYVATRCNRGPAIRYTCRPEAD